MTNICDPRYGQGPSAERPGAGGPFAAGKGTLVTDGVSAFFLTGEPLPTLRPAPANIAGALRPLMRRAKDGAEVSLLGLTAWLIRHFPDCDGCAEGFVDCDHCGYPAADACGSCDMTGKIACACTTRRGRIAGVPVLGWHVRRQLAVPEHRPEKVRLALLRDSREQAALQVSCERWTYLRLGLVEDPGFEMPSFPEAPR